MERPPRHLGPEFHLWHFLHVHYPELDASRSKPGHPNDNRFVEQKNDTRVRAFLGDVRLDAVIQIRYLNHIYERMHVYCNYLQPVMHQIAKVWVPNPNGAGGYTRRQHDLATPPLVRLCQTATLPATTCAALLEQRAALNPLAWRREIYAALQHLFTYSGAVPGLPENVYETLAQPELFPAAMAALQAGETVCGRFSVHALVGWQPPSQVRPTCFLGPLHPPFPARMVNTSTGSCLPRMVSGGNASKSRPATVPAFVTVL